MMSHIVQHKYFQVAMFNSVMLMVFIFFGVSQLHLIDGSSYQLRESKLNEQIGEADKRINGLTGTQISNFSIKDQSKKFHAYLNRYDGLAVSRVKQDDRGYFYLVSGDKRTVLTLLYQLYLDNSFPHRIEKLELQEQLTQAYVLLYGTIISGVNSI